MPNLKLYNNTFGFARSLLALGTLLTLVFNSPSVLFPPHTFLKNQANATGIETSNIFFMFNYEYIWLPYVFSIFVLGIVILGYYPKITCFFHVWVSYSLYHSMLIIEGGDQITAILTLMIFPLCVCDNRKNHWYNPEKTVIKISNTYIYYFLNNSYIFIRFQMAILYLDAGVEKFKVTEWLEGTATYYWFNHNMFGAPLWLKNILNYFFSNAYFVSSVTWGVMFLEIGLFSGFFIKQKYRYILFVLAIFFHFFIFVIHGLPTFGIAMTGGLILYLFNMNVSLKNNFLQLKNSFKYLFYGKSNI